MTRLLVCRWSYQPSAALSWSKTWLRKGHTDSFILDLCFGMGHGVAEWPVANTAHDPCVTCTSFRCGCVSLARYERPQKGRYRQFEQFGVECIGIDHPQCDVEIIDGAHTALQQLQLPGNVVVEVNSLGDADRYACLTHCLFSCVRTLHVNLRLHGNSSA